MLNRLLGKLYKKKSGDVSEAAAGKSPSGSAGAPIPPAGGLLAIEGTIQPAAPGERTPDGVASVHSETRTGRSGKQVEQKEEAGEAVEGAAVQSGDGVDTKALETRIVEALKTIYDPEIPVNIYELGLIYEVKVEPNGMANVVMTLTAPNCPAAGILPGQVESRARSVDGVYDVHLDLTFEPAWTPDRMSDAARLELGML